MFSRIAGSRSQQALGERWGTPWTGRQSVTEPTYRDREPLTLTCMGNLESPINVTCMPCDCGGKPEYSEKTHAGTRRTCKLHTEGPQLAGAFERLLLWGDSASYCTTVPPPSWSTSAIKCLCLLVSLRNHLIHRQPLKLMFYLYVIAMCPKPKLCHTAYNSICLISHFLGLAVIIGILKALRCCICSWQLFLNDGIICVDGNWN